ncbi:MAG: RNA 2',3'-cyclic phosphodiesterase [Chloroflexota bacterium]|nr:RNA 2',3'-cyclic phosphodiesterase [Chloroflexota bacterium]
MGQIRSFIAIEMPGEVKATLGSIIDRLHPAQHRCVKWVAPDSIHLTLKFLGNIDSNAVPGITSAVERVAGGVPAMELNIGGLGMFPNERRPRVIWVALEGDIEPLAELQRNIERAMKPLGFEPEGRGFTPHLTLGRVRDNAAPNERTEIGQTVAATACDWEASFTIREVSLMKSTLAPSGATYNRLALIELKD